MKLVECVPNFSEGRDQSIIDQIAAAIEASDGAHLLDVDPGKDTNRTVVTFVAPPDKVVDAAFNAIATAAQLIDMSKHTGAHSRMGATDVCPFVPVSGVTMDECVELAKQLGKRVGEELGIPVFLYEHAATSEDRRNLATVRSGEYEGLADKLKNPTWKPDFGNAEFNARSGATVIGAREFLIAYNVNLNTRSAKLAHDIAMSIREAGRNKRDANNKFVRDENGVPIKAPGTLKACKAVGWYIDEYKRAQVSINLTNMELTPPHAAFDEVKRQAEERGMRVTGSELVGLVPLQAMLDAGLHYLDMQGVSAGVPEADIIETAVQSLGLDEISEFDPQQKIIEYRVAPPTPLVDAAVTGFVDNTSSDSPVPGGGSVSALAGSLAAALTSMVANLTVGKKGYKDVQQDMKDAAVAAQKIKADLLRAVDDDSNAFDDVMAAMRLPKKSDEDAAARDAAIQAATRRAIDVPLSVIENCERLLAPLAEVAAKGNENSLSDAGVATLCAGTAARGAFLNVLINLPGVTDADYASSTQARATELCAAVVQRTRELYKDIEIRLRKA